MSDLSWNITWVLVPTGVSRQAGQALLAASTAASRSSLPERGIVAIFFPQYGVVTSKVWDEAETASDPPIQLPFSPKSLNVISVNGTGGLLTGGLN